ncbi:MAG: acetyl-CoA carboxylase biotin carboxyl carrier protein [Culicoidibacterales bacterium]
MDIIKVKQLIEALETSSLATLEVSDASGSVKLTKNHSTAVDAYEAVTPAFEYIHKAPTVSEQVQKDVETIQTQTTVHQAKEEIVTSPLVGTFYDKPSPDAKAFVNVGDQVTKGQVICIIEAMKVMNEIKAPVSGIVREITALTGSMVEFDSPLLTITLEG